MPRPSYTFEALGTFWEIITERPLEDAEKNELHELVEAFDQTYSRFRPDSLISKIAKKAGEYTFPRHAEKLFSFYEDLYRITDGKVTPLIGGALEDLGYDATYTFKTQGQVRRVPNYEKTIRRNGTTITTSEPVVIDVGAAGKGYLVDLVAVWLEAKNHTVYVIDASGDILHKGSTSEIVGLEHPLEQGRVIGEVPLKNQALCGSATNRRTWGKGLHHVIDPETGKPTNSIVATWVLADSAMVADGLATSLFFCEPNILNKQYNYEYIRIHMNKTVEYSQYFATLLY